MANNIFLGLKKKEPVNVQCCQILRSPCQFFRHKKKCSQFLTEEHYAIVKILEENNNFFQVLKNLIQNQKSPACFQDLILSFSQIIKMIFCEQLKSRRNRHLGQQLFPGFLKSLEEIDTGVMAASILILLEEMDTWGNGCFQELNQKILEEI